MGSLHITVVRDTSPPTVPAALAATALSETAIQLSWNDSTDPDTGVDHYEVYRDGVKVADVKPLPTGTTIWISQPADWTGIAGHVYVPAKGTGMTPTGEYGINYFDGGNPYSSDGLFVSVAQDCSAKTGFDPVNRATAQLGFQDVAGTSTIQGEGGVIGAFLNTDDTGTDYTANQKMMATPQYIWPIAQQPYFFAAENLLLHMAWDMQIPWAVGDTIVYAVNSFLLTNSAGLQISWGNTVFRNLESPRPALPLTVRDAVTGNYTFNPTVNAGSAYLTTDPSSAEWTNAPWTGWRHFEFTISYAQCAAALQYLDGKWPGLLGTLDPARYATVHTHGNFEIHTQHGTDAPVNVQMGWSMKNFSLWTTLT